MTPDRALVAAIRHAEITAVGIALVYPLWRAFVDWVAGRRPPENKP